MKRSMVQSTRHEPSCIENSVPLNKRLQVVEITTFSLKSTTKKPMLLINPRLYGGIRRTSQTLLEVIKTMCHVCSPILAKVEVLKVLGT